MSDDVIHAVYMGPVLEACSAAFRDWNDPYRMAVDRRQMERLNNREPRYGA